jgi:hypothetical protein
MFIDKELRLNALYCGICGRRGKFFKSATF